MLSDTSFDLSGDNTAALVYSSLYAGSGSMVTVGAGTQNIDGLGFNGGTVDFGKIAPGEKQSNNMVHVSSLDLQGGGAVQVDASGDVIADTVSRDVNTSLSLLEQDDENAAIQLVSVSGNGRVVGSAGGLQLQDQSGQRITDGIQHAVIQNGQKVAEGTYDYRLTSGTNNDGLYIGYGLTQLNLLTSGTDALELDANGKTGNAADMSARITGTGDLAFNSQKGETVSLSNQNNDYTGVTDIRGGNVLMNSNSALGQTSEIRLAADTMLDMDGHSQTAGKLNGTAGSVLNINGGNLTLTEGGVSAGILSGNGALNVSGGVLDITGASSTFTASTTIAKDAVVRMNDVSGLGTGNISNAGTLSLTHVSGSLGNNLSGTGTVSLLSSDTQLSGNNSGYSGLFVVDESSQLTASATENLGTASVNNSGTLVLNSATGWQLTNDVSGSGTVRKTGSGSLTVGNNAAWTGQTDIDAGTLILGNAGAPVMLASSQVNIAKDGILTGFGGVSGNVTNSGTLDLRADAPGNVLTVGGNYTGNNGTLLMNTVLGDDSSATDKLVIKGDASGQTRVEVTKAGGTGAQTLNGIELIHVDGNAGSAEFVQASRIAAGAYDYTLGRGQGSNSGNWYLTSGKNTPDPEPTPTPDPDSKPEPVPGGYDNDLRPEAGSYTANMAAANTMFVTRLHERLGPVQYTDVMTGETKNTSMWMRHEGGHNRWRDGTGQLKTQGNRYVVQMGGDIAQWGRGETDRWHLGVMAGYGNEHNNTDSVRTGYRSKGSVNGYSTGLYATWFANDETHNGAYLDTWAQYGWFDNHVKGDGLPGESWKSKGLTASLETGYTWKAGEFSGSHGSLNEWYVQPQAQVVWMGVKADEHRESNGTRVESTGDGNVRTRLGVKTWIKGHNRMDDGKSREFRPFVEVNWLHNTRDFGTRMNGVTVHQDGARNIGEVKAGVEGQINDRLNLWGNVGVQAGDKGYSDTSAMLGVKYTF
ncbi:TPA: autotransporter outer membrane beta-barrel domain-containing protein [Escherichia coli]